MQRTPLFRKFSAVPDLIIILLMGTLIYGMIGIAREWQADYHPLTQIDLSFWALPRYTLFSAMRGFAAYGLSLAFTLVVGYLAANFARAERILIPLLDILQSIPVLGFLPGLVLGLVALFPHSNTGLELAAVLMIFTGQVWNMTFSFYSSLKSVPTEFQEAATIIGFGRLERLRTVELPFSAVNLTWNSLMSMAGGWFFLSACEAFTLGDRDYRLPGIGAYMAVAVQQSNRSAMIAGVVAMLLLIIAIDFFLWRPMLAWVQRFRLEDVPGAAPIEPLMGLVLRESRLLRWGRLFFRRWRFEQLHAELAGLDYPQKTERAQAPLNHQDLLASTLPETPVQLLRRRTGVIRRFFQRNAGLIAKILTIAVLVLIAFCGWRLTELLSGLSKTTWVILLRNTVWSLLRVFSAVLLSTLWTVPFGIWVGISPKRIRIAQPIIQLMASFPAPMLYPILLALMFRLGMNFAAASMFLMLFGVQWYVLFNVLAGALRIPQQLLEALSLMKASAWDRWTKLYLPSVFPALVTGWVTAAGGAWNATIVAEYVRYGDETLITGGLGAMISQAAAEQNFSVLAASLTLMVAMVILLNQTVWSRIYHLAQTRYRMDL